ncbi:MAG: NUDIX domain-containing protein [Candidatus Andersenbacteria bacterium]
MQSGVQPVGEPREVYKGLVYRILQQPVRHADGRESVYEYVQKPTGVLVIAIDKDEFVTLVRERRIVRRGEPELWALPGGRVDTKESPEKAAARELLEETGLVGDLTFFAKRTPQSRTIWDLRCFIAKKAKKKVEPQDQLETKSVKVFEAVQMALEGSIENDFAALCLIRYAYQTNRAEILEKELDPRLRYD